MKNTKSVVREKKHHCYLQTTRTRVTSKCTKLSTSTSNLQEITTKNLIQINSHKIQEPNTAGLVEIQDATG